MYIHFKRKGDLRLFLKILRDFAGGKGVRNRFLLPQGKLCSAKIVLAPHMSLLRISLRGLRPPNLPKKVDFQLFLLHNYSIG